jgi:hypothetical protein
MIAKMTSEPTPMAMRNGTKPPQSRKRLAAR